MEAIFDEIFRALSYLLIAGVVFFAWKSARDYARDGKAKSVLWKGLLCCVGIAIFASLILGNPTCESTYADPVYGGCESYADDGFEPTAEQRTANFAYFMTLLYIPVVLGAFDGNKLPRSKLTEY